MWSEPGEPDEDRHASSEENAYGRTRWILALGEGPGYLVIRLVVGV